MLGSLKDIFLGKKSHSDYRDVREHILNKPFGEPKPFGDNNKTIGEKFGINQDFPRDPYSPEPFKSPPSSFDEPLNPVNQNQPRRPDPKTDFGPEINQPQEKFGSKNYDILDRLNIIESQLSAIRSQTETINERLKNIDAKLMGRRY